MKSDLGNNVIRLTRRLHRSQLKYALRTLLAAILSNDDVESQEAPCDRAASMASSLRLLLLCGRPSTVHGKSHKSSSIVDGP